MCHTDVPAGQVTPAVARDEVSVPLPGGEALPALLARPEAGRAPGVLVIHDIFGRTPFYEDLAARLAAAGFLALLPDCYFREGGLSEVTLPTAYARHARLDERRTLRELHLALDWLAQQAAGPRLGTIGFCMGGTLVLDLAADRADLASVCYYGFPAPGPHTTERSAPPPLELVDRIQGPILGLWGDQDDAVGIANVVRLREALQGRGVAFECVIYPGAGHAFMGAPVVAPTAATEAAARDAWARTLAFYRTHLAPAGSATT